MSPTTTPRPKRWTSDALRQWRDGRGLLQAEAADYFGVSERTYRRWEGGSVIPRWVQNQLNREVKS